jgi:alpha-L-glutamate ligase-like protein
VSGLVARLLHVRREMLGINRRNHEYLFRWNRRDRWALADDKLATKTALAAAGVPTPATLGSCAAPWELRALPALAARADGFVAKPARGAGGGGVLVVARVEGERLWKPSGAALGWRDVVAHAADVLAGVYSLAGREDVLLVERRVVSDAAMAVLAWGGVPDVRVVVLRGVPLAAMLRLPTRRSDGRANIHLGGLGVGVDLADGRTTHAVAQGRPVAAHPDTGAPLAGAVVPAWDDVLALSVRAADAVGLGFLGVDVVIDAALGPQVLEVNVRPGLAIQLANRTGLRRRLAHVAALGRIPEDVAARVALGRALAAG